MYLHIHDFKSDTYNFFATRYTKIGRETIENRREASEICLFVTDIYANYMTKYTLDTCI